MAFGTLNPLQRFAINAALARFPELRPFLVAVASAPDSTQAVLFRIVQNVPQAELVSLVSTLRGLIRTNAHSRTCTSLVLRVTRTFGIEASEAEALEVVEFVRSVQES